MDVNQKSRRIKGSGSTLVTANGYADYVEVRMSGSSKIDANGLIKEHASIYTSGSVRADIHDIESLECRSYGASRIRYSGNPLIIENRSTGSSSLQG